MRAIVLGSGSKGNSTLIINNEEKLLIDVGFSYPKMKMLLEEFNCNPLDIEGILITHTHKDHIIGLSSFVKKNHTKVYVNEKLFQEISKIIPEENLMIVDNDFSINSFSINVFKTSHDSEGSVGFIVNNLDKSLVYVTDTVYLNNNVLKL